MKRLPRADFDKKSGVWWFRFYVPRKDGSGKYDRPLVCTNMEHKPEAEAFAEKYIHDYVHGKGTEVAPIVAGPLAQSPDLKARIKLYMERNYLGKKAGTTIISNLRHLSYMYKFSPTKLRDEITPDIAEGIYNDYRLSTNRKGKHPSAKTLYHFLTDVCAYWDWEVALRDKVLFNPFSHIDKPSQDEFTVCTTVWDQNEYNKVYEGLEFEEDKEAFLIARYTGMYPKDIFLLSHEDIVNKPGVLAIFVRRSKSISKKQLIRLPIPKAAPEITELVLGKLKLTKPGQRLFCRHYPDNKFKLWGELFGKRVAAAWKRAFPNQPHKTPKDLRHTRTTEWLEAGHEPDEIGAWLGHVDGSKMVLAIYAHRKAMRQLAEASARPLAALPPGQSRIAWSPQPE